MNKKIAQVLLKKVKEDYNSISDEFDISRQKEWKEFDTYLPYIKENDKLADIGCGNGRFYEFLKDKKDIQYIGVDNSEKLIEKAKFKHKDTKFKLGDLLKIPLEDNSQDTVVSIAAFHHIPSKELRRKALKELKRILKKEGTLIISVWNLFQPKYKKYIWKSRIRALLSFGKYDFRDTFIPWGKSGIKRYYYAFTENKLKKLLKQENFEILEKSKGNNIIIICKKSQ